MKILMLCDRNREKIAPCINRNEEISPHPLPRALWYAMYARCMLVCKKKETFILNICIYFTIIKNIIIRFVSLDRICKCLEQFLCIVTGYCGRKSQVSSIVKVMWEYISRSFVLRWDMNIGRRNALMKYLKQVKIMLSHYMANLIN